MQRRKSTGFLPLKFNSSLSVCHNLFGNDSDDKMSLMSPMTELSVNLELSSMLSPRRRLSLTENENHNPQRSVSVAESIESTESGIEIESPLTECPDFDSPIIENMSFRRRMSSSSSITYSMRRQIISKCNISSPVRERKPLEPLNFNNVSSPFKPIDNLEENHSDLSLCEMSDQFPELEDSCPFTKKKKAGRSLSAPPSQCDVFDSQDFDSCSKASDDDGFFDEYQRDFELNNCQISSSAPSNFMGLLAGPIMSRTSSTSGSDVPEEDKENVAPLQTQNALAKPVFRKPIGLPIRKSRSKSFSVKRDNPATDNSPSPVSRKKRPRFYRSQSCYDVNPMIQPVQKLFTVSPPAKPKCLIRSQSFDTHKTMSPSVDITSLLDMDDKNLVGDRSREYCLPLAKSKHPDLKAITPETLGDVIEGKYNDTIDEYHIIDSRYPYEFNGGHIKGGRNIYEKQELYNEFIKNPKCPANKRQIFIFHCEFSSKRGPDMCRFLRNKDRDAHQHCYPNLYYPEMYLLEGGYKEFYAERKELCEPQEYREMVHPDYAQDCKLFSKRSKSWSEGEKRKSRRTGLRY